MKNNPLLQKIKEISGRVEAKDPEALASRF